MCIYEQNLVSLAKVGNSFGRQPFKPVIPALSHNHQGQGDRGKLEINGKTKRKNSDLVHSRRLIIADDRK